MTYTTHENLLMWHNSDSNDFMLNLANDKIMDSTKLEAFANKLLDIGQVMGSLASVVRNWNACTIVSKQNP